MSEYPKVISISGIVTTVHSADHEAKLTPHVGDEKKAPKGKGKK